MKRAAATGLLSGVLGAAAWCVWIVLDANNRDQQSRAEGDDWNARRFDVFDAEEWLA